MQDGKLILDRQVFGTSQSQIDTTIYPNKFVLILSMSFTNQNIRPDDLPTIEEVTFHPLENDYLKAERISFSIAIVIFLAIAIPLFYFIDKIQSPLIVLGTLALFLFLAILFYISIGIDFKYSGYALRERDLLYRSGWFIRKVRVVMINRIQHVSVQSGPIERKFGLSSVSIYTAGASEADFTIKGISGQTAQNIKEWISNKLNGDINQ